MPKTEIWRFIAIDFYLKPYVVRVKRGKKIFLGMRTGINALTEVLQNATYRGEEIGAGAFSGMG